MKYRCFDMKHGEKKKKKIRRLIIILLVFLGLSVWSWVPFRENFKVSLKDEGSYGIRMVLITDLHSCYYGKGQKSLISKIEKEEPDMVMLGGDIFDDKLGDKNAELLLQSLADKYPCFYVTGNHEFWSGRADEIKEYLESIGVTVLAGDCKTIEKNGVFLDICGVDDPTDMTTMEWKKQLDAAYAKTQESHVRILLSHRPEKVSVYEEYDFDLILSGHAHAGQFRIPIINRGLYAPDQGFMAKYVDGTYKLSNGSILVVSRGLARESLFMPRFFNHPQILTIEI